MSLQVVGSAASAGLSISQQHKLAFPVYDIEPLCQERVLGLHNKQNARFFPWMGNLQVGQQGLGWGCSRRKSARTECPGLLGLR